MTQETEELIITKFHTRMLAHIRELCPFPVSITDAIAVDEYCIKHKVNPNLKTLQTIFADKFSEYSVNKKRRNK